MVMDMNVEAARKILESQGFDMAAGPDRAGTSVRPFPKGERS